jgi:hypothetical protein
MLLTHIYIYTHTYTHIPQIPKFAMVTIGYGISNEDTEHTDKFRKNKTKTTQT